jgi:hypothetical protein
MIAWAKHVGGTNIVVPTTRYCSTPLLNRRTAD